ncbi:hypothetical protein KDK95_24175 [Actinospica sp. MGRD01-02]|uniref:Uncharacterized protein n=1 Tax=Actinospica acidithermotolerans TaxID=2828514 RepID=A0A941EDB9_9ACTN|nr:hypothetical protein [Actinospica acidithermotolerans]MBR7829426.1 hypothetical protein [Actinospica acidithermotolerans]
MIDQQDQQLYDEVGTAFADVRLERDATDVIRRGRTLRRRRKAVPALAAAGVLAFSLSLAAVTVQTHPSSRTTLVNVNVDEAAFSVHTNATTGVMTITIRDFHDENLLKQTLADAGIPAVFHSEKVTVVEVNGGERVYGQCNWVGATELTVEVATYSFHAGVTIFTLYPSRMPHGSVLAFNYTTQSDGKRLASAQLFASTPTGCVV